VERLGFTYKTGHIIMLMCECVCVCVCMHARIFKVHQQCRSHAEIKLKVIKSTAQTRINWVKLYVY